MRSKYFKVFIITGICCMTGIIILLMSGREERPAAVIDSEAEETVQDTGIFDYIRSFFTSKKISGENAAEDNIRLQWVIEKMKERYTHKLGNKGIQVRLLEGLIRYMKKSHPDDWKARIKAIIDKEFPEHAAELTDKLNKLETYHKFIDERKGELSSMSHDRRKDEINEKRKEIFGNEYYEIFKSSIAREEMRSVMNKIDTDKKLSLDDKLAAFTTVTREFYPNEPDKSLAETDDDVMVRNYKFAKQFLEMPSVQAQLKEMNENERATFLRKARETMGLQKDVVDKMAELDKTSDELWMLK